MLNHHGLRLLQQQKPAKTSSKAMWIEACQAKAGDVVLWCEGGIDPPLTVEAVRFGWWRKVYMQANGNPAALVVPEVQAIRVLREQEA